ncbi:competence/damage-inducible protein A [Terrilactibacillus laevilacticus]|uniref:competence/damage-inducible protein A n=1 Tax=Terrilactibacillus laevilacticus TaxID=1380157 RepID=UPI0011476239|nr:competence/damage-inducible protein A [Terrilactibacillus laevilacticus]
MNAELIAVGSELLLGQIANTNAQFISEQLAQLGINVFYHTVVGDNQERLSSAIKIAESRSDMIIFTGGLGPTKDDLTKETISRELGRKLVVDQEALNSILSYFKKTGRVMTENNRKQALIIEGSDSLPNRHGMAPGMLIEIKNKTYILLPGPPNEMKPMFVNSAVPLLAKMQTNPLHSRVLRFFGIGESALETELMDLIDTQSNPTIAPLAKESEVTIRLTAKHEKKDVAIQLLDDIEEKISLRVGDYLYGYGEQSLPETVFCLLKKHQKTIAFAESLTGGLASQLLTDIPGASEVFKGSIVSYTNEVKSEVLGVPTQTLETYGAVSAECSKDMAKNIQSKCKTTIGLSFTGVAGPDKSENKEVGTVFIGLADGQNVYSFPYQFSGTRSRIRLQSAKTGYDLVRRYLRQLSPFGK